jgi:TRAP-type C4-dicarboxylate transport system permease small subunit
MNHPSSISRLERCIVWIGAISLMALGILICASVALRMAGSVITGSGELGEMLIIIVAAASLVAATLGDSHPHVHMIVDRLSPKVRAWVAASIACAGALYWTAAAWMNGKIAVENARLVEETELLQISLTPFRAVWIVALLLIALLLVWRAVRVRRDSRDPQ